MNIIYILAILAGASISVMPAKTIVVTTEVRSPAPLAREQTEPKDYLYSTASRSAEVCGYSKNPKCRQVNIAEQLDEIILRESRWGRDGTDYGICNTWLGCGSGQGLIQLIESTRKHCEEKLKKLIDATNPWDSIDCGIYLLEDEGINHWDAPDGSWGSGPY